MAASMFSGNHEDGRATAEEQRQRYVAALVAERDGYIAAGKPKARIDAVEAEIARALSGDDDPVETATIAAPATVERATRRKR